MDQPADSRGRSAFIRIEPKDVSEVSRLRAKIRPGVQTSPCEQSIRPVFRPGDGEPFSRHYRGWNPGRPITIAKQCSTPAGRISFARDYRLPLMGWTGCFSAGLAVDYSQATTGGVDDPLELSPYLSWSLRDGWSLDVYGLIGLSGGSPDSDGGAHLLVAF